MNGKPTTKIIGVERRREYSNTILVCFIEYASLAMHT